MKRILITSLLLFYLFIDLHSLYGQAWPKVYGNSNGASISDLKLIYDNGYLLTAYTYDNSGMPEYDWIIKLDINGNILWTKKFGDGNYTNGLLSSAITLDHGVIVSGATSKYSISDYDPIFIKTDACGEIEWCKVLHSPDQNYGTGILQLSDGTYVGMLQYYGEGPSYSRISLIKMDQSGEPIWIQRLAQEDTLIYNEEGEYLYLTTDSNYLISGRAYHPGCHPYWITSDSSGIQIWNLFWNNFTGQAHQVIEKDSGIFFSTSWCFDASHPQSPVLLKFDNSGNRIDSYFLMGDTINSGSANAISKFNDTTLIIDVAWKNVPFPVDAGFSEVFLTDTLGTLIKRRLLLNEFQSLDCIIISSDNKILAAGSYVVTNRWEIYLWKMNSDLEDDTLYTQPMSYDSLCPYPIQSDTVDLDCSIFVNIDEIPTKEQYESTIKIMPDPARDWITLVFPEKKDIIETELSIYNSLGQSVLCKKVQAGMELLSIDITSIPPGFYVAVCKTNPRKLLTGKFIKSE